MNSCTAHSKSGRKLTLFLYSLIGTRLASIWFKIPRYVYAPVPADATCNGKYARDELILLLAFFIIKSDFDGSCSTYDMAKTRETDHAFIMSSLCCLCCYLRLVF